MIFGKKKKKRTNNTIENLPLKINRNECNPPWDNELGNANK